MSPSHTEEAFEGAIEEHLLTRGGFSECVSGSFDRERAIDEIHEYRSILVSVPVTDKIDAREEVQ